MMKRVAGFCCLRKLLLSSLAILLAANLAPAQDKKPNILFIVSDDTGYGDLGPYGGGEGRGACRPPTSTAWPPKE